MHMVHEGADGKIFVLAVLFELSSSSSTELLKSVTKNIDHISVPGTKTETGALDFSELKKLIDTSKLFSYQGSLTTPPCAEGLTFIIPQTPMALDVETYNAIKKTVKFNSRFTQNGAGQANVLDPGCKANNGTGGSCKTRIWHGLKLTLNSIVVLHPNPSNSTTASSTASPPAQTAESVSGDGPDCKKNIQRVKRNRWARF